MTTLLLFNNFFFNNFFCLLFQLVLVEKRQVKSLPSAHQFFSFGLDLVLLFFFRLSSPLPPPSLPDPEDEDEDDDPLPELLPEPELLLPLSLLLPEEDEEEEEEEASSAAPPELKLSPESFELLAKEGWTLSHPLVGQGTRRLFRAQGGGGGGSDDGEGTQLIVDGALVAFLAAEGEDPPLWKNMHLSDGELEDLEAHEVYM